MRVVLFRRFVDALHPTPRKQRPEKHCSWNNEYTKTPAPVRGVWINLRRTQEYEWNGENQADGEVNAEHTEQDGRDVHDQ